mmetsp:Transcript_93529/g.185576  ORF Transcript_93529/g.185576 Transcript_93529/m.185576 type:complete len:92 (-) Transcript_93529:338-613(-)
MQAAMQAIQTWDASLGAHCSRRAPTMALCGEVWNAAHSMKSSTAVLHYTRQASPGSRNVGQPSLVLFELIMSAADCRWDLGRQDVGQTSSV